MIDKHTWKNTQCSKQKPFSCQKKPESCMCFVDRRTFSHENLIWKESERFLTTQNSERQMSSGTHLSLICEDGFYLEGEGDFEPSATCTDNGDFLIDMAGKVCKPGCSGNDLEAFLFENSEENLKISDVQFKTSYKTEERTKISCSSGYSLRGNSEVVCKENRTWEFQSDYPFKCLRNCPYPNPIENAYQDPFTMRSVYSFNDQIYFSCHQGFAMKKECDFDCNENFAELTCQFDGTWSEPNFECLPGCGLPPNFKNGKILEYINKKVDSYFEIGDELTYVCDWGYSMDENIDSFKLVCDGGNQGWKGFDKKFECKRNRPTMAGWRRRYG